MHAYAVVVWNADLSCGLNPPDAADIEHTPGSYQGQNNPPLQAPGIIDSFGGVESLSVPEVVDGAAPSALLYQSCKDPYGYEQVFSNFGMKQLV